MNYHEVKAGRQSAPEHTEREDADARRQLGERRFQSLFENIVDAVFIADTETGMIVDANPAALALVGQTREELIGSHQCELHPPELVEEVRRVFANAEECAVSGEFVNAEVRHADGHIIPVEIRTGGVIEMDGRPCVIGILRDITERKQAEDALKESEERLSDTQRVGNIGSFTLDVTTGRWSGTDMLYPILGVEGKEEYSVEEWVEIIHPDHRDDLVAYQQSVLEKKTAFNREYQIIRQSDGKTRWVHSRGELQFDGSDNVIGMIGTTQDITERKQMENTLRDSEERFRLSMEATHDGLWDWEVATNNVYFSPGYYRMIGYDDHSAMAKYDFWKERLHPDDTQSAVQANKACIEGDCESFEAEFRMQAKDGSWRWILGRGKCITRNAQGRALRMVGTHVDITERKTAERELARYRDNLEQLVKERTAALEREIVTRQQAEAALHESEAKYRNLVDGSSSIVLEWDTTGTVLYMNQHGLDFFGFTPDEIIGHNVLGAIVEPMDSAGYDFAGKVADFQQNPEHYYSSENENVCKNGDKVWIAWTNRGIYDSDGRLIRTLSVGIDRTRQRVVEKQLTGSIECLRMAQEASRAGTWDWDLSKDRLEWSPELRKVYGLPSTCALDSMPWIQGVLPEDRDRVIKKVRQATVDHSDLLSDYRVVLPDGEIRWLRITGRTLYEQDQPMRMLGLCLDITDHKRAEDALRIARDTLEEMVAQRTSALTVANQQLRKEIRDRKQAEEALREREAMLSGIFNNLQDAYFQADLSGRFTFVNPAAPAIYGVGSEEDMIGMPAQDLYVDAADREALLVELRKNGSVTDWVCLGRRQDGSTFWASLNAQLIRGDDGQVVGTEGVVRDVSERKRAEKELQERLHIETLVAELAGSFVGVDARHSDSEIENALQRICEFFDLDMGAIWQPPESNPDTQVLKYMYRRDEGPPLPDAKDARKHFPWVLGQLRKTGATVAITDMAELPPEAARDKEVYMHFGITNSINLPLKDTDGTLLGVLSFNASTERTISRVVISRLEMFANILFALIARTRGERSLAASHEERDKLQAQFIQAQKMESVGRLAGGVAHDYNNMLGVILGYTELALSKVDPASSLHADLIQIFKSARRSADITRQLLAFARKQTIAPKVLDINEVLESMLNMLRHLIGENINLAWLPESRLWPIEMDPTQVEQILVNLCVNARDAIAGVGKVTIETHTVTFDEKYCADHAGFVPGDFILLAVSDDGCGMDKETLERIFEPFFTTKDLNRGTGLGLATVYGIVKQNSGSISVHSEPGKGTTFKIYLPRHVGKAEKIRDETVTEIPTSHGEMVLLVEDEPAIREVGQVMLERLGYRVLTAATPGEALRLAGEHKGLIHLLITDVVMPEMNGRDLADRLHTLYPDIKILFMSGYTADVIAHHGVLEEGVQFLQKPFSMKELATKVREVLGEE